jgi:hypothetical protein
VVAHACNPSSTQEAEAGGSRVPGQSELHSKAPTRKQNKTGLVEQLKW